MGWATAFFVFFLLLLVISLLPVGILLQYEPGEMELRFTLWKMTFVLYPVVEKKKKPKKKRRKNPPPKSGKQSEKQTLPKAETKTETKADFSQESEAKSSPKSNETKSSETREKEPVKTTVRLTAKKPKKEKVAYASLEEQVTLMKEFLPLVLFLFQRLGRYKKIERLELNLVVGSTDPVEATLLYGKAHAMLGTIWLPLDHALNIQKGRAAVQLDFETTQVSVYGVLAVSMTIGQICYLTGHLGLKGYKIWKTGGEKNG